MDELSTRRDNKLNKEIKKKIVSLQVKEKEYTGKIGFSTDFYSF